MCVGDFAQLSPIVRDEGVEAWKKMFKDGDPMM